MKQVITYQYRIYPNKEQELLLSKHFSAVVWVYNWGLERKIQFYKKNGKAISRYNLQKELTILKREAENSWLNGVNSQSLQMALLHLDSAFTRFFREKHGFPKPKNRSTRLCISFPQKSRASFVREKLYLMKFREGIKCVFHREFDGIMEGVTISQVSSGKYYASVLVRNEILNIEEKPVKYDTAIGIDLGIKDYLITSDGKKYPNPKYLKLSEKKLRRERRRLSRMIKGGKNWTKQRVTVAKLHERIKNQRTDYLHKISRELVDSEVDTFCIENLNIKGMLKNRRLSKAITDCGWREFTSFLKYKSEWAGKNVLEIGRFEPSSKTCSVCGAINKRLTLADRVWVCECGAKHDRDINAAINIRDFAFDKQNLIGLGKPKSTPMEIGQ